MNFDGCSLVNLAPSAAKTATSSSSALDLDLYEGDVVVVLDSALGTGNADNTLNCSITHCDTSGGSYTAVSGASFTQVSTAASQQMLKLNSDGLKRYIKILYTIAGTTPSFVFSANVLAFPKYRA